MDEFLSAADGVESGLSETEKSHHGADKNGIAFENPDVPETGDSIEVKMLGEEGGEDGAEKFGSVLVEGGELAEVGVEVGELGGHGGEDEGIESECGRWIMCVEGEGERSIEGIR